MVRDCFARFLGRLVQGKRESQLAEAARKNFVEVASPTVTAIRRWSESGSKWFG